jgi:hypothetical protein
MRLLFLAAAILLGCHGGYSERIGPRTFSIQCRGELAECYRAAARICRNGFDVQDRAGLDTARQRYELIVHCRHREQQSTPTANKYDL